MDKYFVIFGESSRGEETLYGKKWVEAESGIDALKKVLRTEKELEYYHGWEDDSDAEDFDQYFEQWYWDNDEKPVHTFADDIGYYVYAGKSELETLQIWSDETY